MSFFKKPAFIASVATVLILVFALIFMSVGMADNGDFFRVLTANDLYSLQTNTEDQYFGYFNEDYGIRQYYNDFTGGSITTSQSIFVRAAVALDVFITHDSVFDVRYLAGIEILMLAFGIFLFVDYLTYKKSTLAGYLIAALVVFVFADLAYGAYFNSFFSEATVYVAFMMCISSALLLGQKRGYNPYFLMITFGVGALLLIFAKQQNAPLGVVFAILCGVIALRTKLKPLRGMALAIAGILAVSGIAVYMLIPQKFVDINKYQTMTRGTTLSSDNPEEALSQFLIGRQYALLNGTTTFDRYPAIMYNNEMMNDDFYSKFSYMDVAMFYLKNPNQLYTMMDYASQNLYYTRPEMLGNYTKEAGMEYGAKTDFFVVYSTWKQNATPKTIGFLIVWCLAAILLGLRNKYQMVIIILSILMGLSQILVSIVGDGDADFAKHVFLYTLVFDYVNVIGFSWFISFACGRRKPVKAKTPAPALEQGYYTEYPEERRARYGERHSKNVRKNGGAKKGPDSTPGDEPGDDTGTRKGARSGRRSGGRSGKKSRRVTACLCLLLSGSFLTTGCAANVVKPSETEAAGAVSADTAQQNTEYEEKTYDFVRQKMASGGGVRTNYLDEAYNAAYATGAEVLSESQGLYMLYTAQRKDQANFDQALEFTEKNLDNSVLLTYRYDPTGEHIYYVNAALDDLRIIRALLVAGETFNNEAYNGKAAALAKRFLATNVQGGQMVDFYDSEYKMSNDAITLCYIDTDTLQKLAGIDGSYKSVADKMKSILKNGMISESFPMFYTAYSYKDTSYQSGEGISMVQSLLCALHLAQTGDCPEETIAFIKDKVAKGQLYGEYDEQGRATNNVESTALYAIAALIGSEIGDNALYNESITRMKNFMVGDAGSEVYGAYANAATKSAYSFDNLMALLALRAGDSQ